MKKLILLAGIYCLAQTIQAQSGSSVTMTVAKTTLQSADRLSDGSDVLTRETVNARALRDFRETYPNVNNESWSLAPNKEIVCSFREPGIVTQIYYRKKGYRRVTIRSYEGVSFNKDVADQVNSTYKGYHISHVNEINVNGLPPAYIINLEVLDHIKVVRVIGDDIEEQEQITKP
jgi:hypothetical protein